MLTVSPSKKALKYNRAYFFISIFALAFLLVLSFPGARLFAASETISCNGGGSRTLTVGTYTDSDGSQFSDGADLTLNAGTGGPCTFTLNLLGTDSAINLSSLTIGNTVTLTHDAAITVDGTYYKIDLNISGNLTVESGGSIDVTGKGLNHSNTTFYGYGFYANGSSMGELSSGAQGGSHGGRGGKDFFGLVAPVYDSISHPTLPGGSGGGAGSTRGGGVVHIAAANADVDGTILADGTNANNNGNGAGGTIYLNVTGNLTGTGTLSAIGGGAPSSYGGGGGGRIAVYYTAIDGTLNLQAYGGDGGSSDGSAGSIYKKPAAQTYGDLSFDNGLSTSPSFATEFPASYIYPADSVALYGGAYVFHTLTLSNSATLEITSYLDPNGTGTSDSARKFYISDTTSCSADYNDTSGTNGQIQYDVGFLTDASSFQSDYVCVAPEYIISITTASSTAKESVAAGSFEVSLPGISPDDITVDYAIKAASTTATGGGVDYALADGTLTIASGDTTNTVDFTISEDAELEPDEVFVVELSNPSFGIVGQKYFTYTIDDNDTPGVTLDDGDGVSITEGSTTYDTYTMVLDAVPTATVTIHLSGDADVTTTASSLTFTVDNWDTPQTVTAVPINDSIAEGSHTGTISHSVSSTDPGYDGLSVASVDVSISDNDFAGVTVTQSGGTTRISENGLTDTYTFVLNTIPTAAVTINITPGDEVTVSTSSVTFFPSTWNIAQTITITAVDDADSDPWDNANITHSAVSEDTEYNSIFVNSIFATVIDNESASVTVSASGGSTALREGGAPDTITVNLEKAPTADVVITVNDSADFTASPSELTFTSSNWLTPQTVTLTAVDDSSFEGSEFSSVTFSANSTDMDYMGISINSLSFTIYDNDGFTVTESGGSTDVVEGGATDSFSAVLDEDPFSDVTINLTTSTQYTLSTTTLYFHSSDWDTPQTVTVTAVDDLSIEGNHTATVSSSISTFSFKYSNTIFPNITINIADNDLPAPGVTISQTGGTTTLTEGGATDTYTIVLDAEPAANVTVAVTPDADSTVSTSSILFTPANWDTPQTITVTAVNDDRAEGGHSSTISHSATSTDGDYDGIDIVDVVASITDNDTAGFTVGAISGNTSEAGTTSTFTVVLLSEPTSDVVIPVSSSDTSEDTVSPSTLTFTSGNWDTPQTITVTGVDDFLIDGSINSTIMLGTVTSLDANYNNANPNDVAVTNTDNDVAGFTISASSGNTSEAGGSATFTVVLDTEPTANVEIPVSTSDVTEGTPLPTTLTFTSGNWDTPQTITVTGADDTDVDGTVAYTIILGNASSTDDDYDGLNPDDVALSNTDNDVAAPSQQGGGSGTVPNSVQTIPFSEAQARIQDVVLTNDSPVVVRIGSVTHRITRVSATASRATIIIQSDPITLTLNKGETKTLDTDNDKVDDLEVTYLGIVGKNPEFTFRDLTNGKLTEEKRPFTINNNAKVTNERDVILTFQVEKMVEMAISNTSDFAGSIYQPYVSSTSWKLSEGTGEKTVYVRFRNKAGLIAETKYSIVYNPHLVGLPSSNSCSYSGKAVKTANSPAVYLIGEMHDAKGNSLAQTCGKRLFPTSALYFSYFSTWKDVVVISQSELDAISSDGYTSIPYGPRFVPTTGTLIKKVSDPKIYLVFGGQAHWIETEVVFKAAGLMFDWVKEVIGDVFTKIPIGSSIQDKNQIPKEIEKHDAPVVIIPTHSTPSVEAQAKAFNRFLGIGSSGEDVKNLQIILTNLGYFSAQPTGYFGPVTSDAVKAFQKDRGIDQKGHVGPATREALNSL